MRTINSTLLYLFVFLILNGFLPTIVILSYLLLSHNGIGEAMAAINDGSYLSHVTPLLIGEYVASLAILAVFIMRKWASWSADYLKGRPWRECLWCVVMAIGTIVPSMVLQQWMPEPSEQTAQLMRSIMSNPWGGLSVCIIVPLVEETVFRGAVLRRLLSGIPGQWTAISLSALIFGIAHMNFAQLPHAFLLGMLLGWAYCLTGSIVPGLVIHSVNNTIVYLLSLAMPEMEEMTMTEMFGGTLRLTLAVVLSLFILLFALKQILRYHAGVSLCSPCKDDREIKNDR